MNYRIVLSIKNELGEEENAVVFPGFRTKDSVLSMFSLMCGRFVDIYRSYRDKEKNED